MYIKPIPLSARSKAWVCGRSVVRTASSNPNGSMDIFTFMWPCLVTNFLTIKPTRCSTKLYMFRTVRLSETCRVSCQGKFVKLLHLVGFIVRMHGCLSVVSVLCFRKRPLPRAVHSSRGVLLSVFVSPSVIRCSNLHLPYVGRTVSEQDGKTKEYIFWGFLTVHHSIDLFHLPTLMHNSFIH